MHTTIILAADTLYLLGMVGLGILALFGLIILVVISQYLQLWLQAFCPARA